MYESDEARLNALRLQRQRVQELLAWLNGEIADAEKKVGGSSQSAEPAPSIVAPSTAPAPKVDETAVAAEAEAMLEEYRRPTQDLQRDVRTGCFLYFAAALLITAALVVILYFALRHN